MTNNNIFPKLTGYIEGYYGRLLSWPARHQLLAVMSELGMNSYFYAPKDDPAHRYYWRTPYENEWRSEFLDFAAASQQHGIHLIAGIAPGLDFNFADFDSKAVGDFDHLVKKAKALLSDGASQIALLMDDISADFSDRAGQFDHEGIAHAELANRLATAINQPIIVVPRIYADSLIAKDDSQSLSYLKDFTARLLSNCSIAYCGNNIIAQKVGGDLSGHIESSRLLIWDNFYANDYCPRRLFIGPWRRRLGNLSIMLNPTGMLETDKLLLRLMSVGDNTDNWRHILKAYVPEAFFTLAFYFDAPFGFISKFSAPPIGVALEAIDILLWQWKSPLQLEWYPVLLGLKQDLLIKDGQMPNDRIAKTQFGPLIDDIGKNSA